MKFFPEDRLCSDFFSAVKMLRQVGKQNKPFYLCHVSNENPGGTKQQMKFRGHRRQCIGVLKGALDYVVTWEGGKAWMEAKRKKGLYGASTTGYCTPEQKAFIKGLDEMKVPNIVFRTVDEGITFLIDLGLIKE